MVYTSMWRLDVLIEMRWRGMASERDEWRFGLGRVSPHAAVKDPVPRAVAGSR